LNTKAKKTSANPDVFLVSYQYSANQSKDTGIAIEVLY